MASPTLYALLVGIDAYRAPVPRLSGCRNDIADVGDYLDSGAVSARQQRVCLLDEQATRSAVIHGFRAHLGRARIGDSALFWFSGHGSRAPVPPEFARLEPDGSMQSIVCADSRHNGVPDLYDKELAVLIADVAAGGAHVTVVLDCCHAGGGTRTSFATPRLAPHLTQPPAAADLLAEVRTAADAPNQDPERLLPVRDDHVALSACASGQTAYELMAHAGTRRGAFSLALLGELRRQGPAATYRELLSGARCTVENLCPHQVPVLFPQHVERLADQPFLGGIVRTPPATMQMRCVRGSWEVDAGLCHGLRPDPTGASTVLAVAGSRPTEEVLVVRSLGPSKSIVEPVRWQPDPNRQYPLVTARVAVPETAVAFTGEGHSSIDAIRAAIRRAAPDGRPSPHVREVAADDPMDPPDLLVIASGSGAARVTAWDGTPYLPEIGQVDRPAGADVVVRALEHIARWRLVRGLRNPVSGIGGLIRLEFVAALDGERVLSKDRPPLEPDESGAIVLRFRRKAGGWVAPRVFVRLRNTADRPLFCALLDLTDQFRIHPDLFPGAMVGPRRTAWAASGRTVRFTIPDGRPTVPGASSADWIMLLVAEQEFNTAHYRLPSIGERVSPAAGRGFAGLLDRFGRAAIHRDLAAEVGLPYDWTTSVVAIRTVVPG